MPPFPVTVEVEDNFKEAIHVEALPPMGTMLNIHGKGTFKVREIEFHATPGDAEPAKIILRCVPVLAF